MPAEAAEPTCYECRLTPTEIARAYPSRVPSVSLDPNAGRHYCNRCWQRLPPFGPPRVAPS